MTNSVAYLLSFYPNSRIISIPNASSFTPIIRSPSTFRPPKFPAHLNLIVYSTPTPISFVKEEHTPSWIQTAVISTVLFLSLTAALRVSPVAASTPLLPNVVNQTEDPTITQGDGGDYSDRFENEDMKAAFEAWKSKTYALSVPFTLVALRGSIPPSWVKDFTKSQGKRLKFRTNLVGNLENIFSDLSASFSKRNITVAADVVGIGDSWLKFAIKKAFIEPIREVEDQDWFKGLSDKWKEL